MTSPTPPTPPPSPPVKQVTLPEYPSTTPGWLVVLFSLLMLVAGPLLAFWNPSGKLNTGIAQALVVMAFVVISGVIFVVHIAIQALHKYGWSKQSLAWFIAQSESTLSEDIKEFKKLWPVVAPVFKATASKMAPTTMTSTSISASVSDTPPITTTGITGKDTGPPPTPK